MQMKSKQEIIQAFGKNETDTGSTTVQVALLTERIKYLTEHFKIHKKDNHGRRGLIGLVNRRRRLLTYLKATDLALYKQTIESLGLRK